VRFIGIDGCRGGWLIARNDEPRGSLTFEVSADITLVFRTVTDQVRVAIDIPIGLPAAGVRGCDLAARRLLGPKQGSRVFPAPSRAALAGVSYKECCELNRGASGVAISKQTHAILPKICEVDREIMPHLQSWIREAHPEVSFRVAKGSPLAYSKKKAEGHEERLAILHDNDLRVDPAAERMRLGRSVVTIDDVLDATVCLLTARRIAAGVAQVLGDEVVDARGLRMEIVA